MRVAPDVDYNSKYGPFIRFSVASRARHATDRSVHIEVYIEILALCMVMFVYGPTVVL